MSWLMIAILAIIVVLAITAIPVFMIRQAEYRRTGKHPVGYYTGWGMAIGMALGMPLGIAMDNIALGSAMGLPLGLAIGVAMERRHKDELRPRTECEEKMQKVVIAGLVALMLVGVIAFLTVYFFYCYVDGRLQGRQLCLSQSKLATQCPQLLLLIQR